MERVFEHIPVLLSCFVPLSELGKLAAHEVQLFARVGIHIHIKCPCLREFHIIIAPHLLNDGRLAVNVFIVGDWQQIKLIVEILHGKGYLAMVIFSLCRWGAEVIESVVHPAQIPLVVKAKAIILNGSCYLGECGGILRNKHCSGVEGMKP